MRIGSSTWLWLGVLVALSGCKRDASSDSGAESTDTIEIEGSRPAASPSAPPDVAAAPDSAQKSESGLAWIVLTEGEGGAHPDLWDEVVVNYRGWKPDGTLFESSLAAGQPVQLPLNRVIAGWQEGIQLMTKGESRRFWIPAALGYGEETGVQGGAFGPPLGPLVFDVELLDIVDGAPPPPTPDDVAAIPSNAKRRKSGLATRVLMKGKGKKRPRPEDKVAIYYTSWTTDGTMFDNSSVPGDPALLEMPKLIPGLSEALQLMVVGEKRRIWMPPKLAYEGHEGYPQGMVVVDVELVDINP